MGLISKTGKQVLAEESPQARVVISRPQVVEPGHRVERLSGEVKLVLCAYGISDRQERITPWIIRIGGLWLTVATCDPLNTGVIIISLLSVGLELDNGDSSSVLQCYCAGVLQVYRVYA